MFPQTWVAIGYRLKKLLVGAAIDSDNCGYSVVLVDISGPKLWSTSSNEKSTRSALELEGFLDLDKDKLRIILQGLRDSIYDGSVSILSTEDITTTAELTAQVYIKSHDLKWTLWLAESQENLDLQKFIIGQFAAMSRLENKLDALSDLVHQKDHYIRYLTESYKVINGDELLKKYNKINPRHKEAVGVYDEKKWNDSISETETNDTEIWDLIGKVVGSRWSNNAEKGPSPKKFKSSSSKLALKQEPISSSVKLEPHAGLILETKAETNNQLTHPKKSPRKRQGMFRVKKKS
ncbi:hypothetical protein PSN45_005274 [Yamadazyma tenuis]|uniref:uncharacterized protein n=1 Tax=Candida tenuis TaxID=2315449 RepID=UPI0027A05EB0|nr:hypothetical protein PSN45_005274 [Yamadazyma tenuis]